MTSVSDAFETQEGHCSLGFNRDAYPGRIRSVYGTEGHA